MNFKKEIEFSDKSKIAMLALAREAIFSYLSEREFGDEIDFDLKNYSLGVFVTLRKSEELRGCIGSIFADRELQYLIPEMAIASATRDHRFLPVSLEELDDISIEISILSPFLNVDNIDDIIIGQHGLMIEHLGKRGVFLPEVAESQGWNKTTYLEELCYKAGLAPDIIKEKPRLLKFESVKISDDNEQISSK